MQKKKKGGGGGEVVNGQHQVHEVVNFSIHPEYLRKPRRSRGCFRIRFELECLPKLRIVDEVKPPFLHFRRPRIISLSLQLHA